MLKLAEKYAGDGRVGFEFVDNTGTTPKPGSIDALRNLDYTGVGERLQALLDQRLEAGSISRLVYNHGRSRGGAEGDRTASGQRDRIAEELAEEPSDVLDAEADNSPKPPAQRPLWR